LQSTVFIDLIEAQGTTKTTGAIRITDL
jgi:hypothetical protein